MKKIYLTRGHIALVDDEDYEYINSFHWGIKASLNTFYANRYIRIDNKRTVTYMHHILIPSSKRLHVDHKDGNGLNNQKSNLRICTTQENLRNMKKVAPATSKFKGVHLHRQTNKWRAVIKWEGKPKHLGLYLNEEDAAKAYDKAAEELFGKFCRLNFHE